MFSSLSPQAASGKIVMVNKVTKIMAISFFIPINYEVLMLDRTQSQFCTQKNIM
jgi:lipocalin